MRIAGTLFLIFSIVLAQAQTLAELEGEMAGLQVIIGSGSDVAERLEASAKFEELLIEAFDFKEAFNHPFNALLKVAKHTPEDEEFRIFNWNIALEEGKHTYRMFILFPNGKYRRFDDSQELNHEDETLNINPEEWYGALYYEIRPVKIKRDTYYTLIGWDGNDELTTKKVLDVLVLEKKNQVSLGFPIFEKGDELVNRRVFEYAKEGIMNLRWLEPKEMIIFDRLEPKTQNLEGNYAFYGPGTAHDGYQWEGDYWELHKLIDMSRPKSSETGAQFNFPDRPDLNRKREDTNPLIGK